MERHTFELLCARFLMAVKDAPSRFGSRASSAERTSSSSLRSASDFLSVFVRLACSCRLPISSEAGMTSTSHTRPLRSVPSLPSWMSSAHNSDCPALPLAENHSLRTPSGSNRSRQPSSSHCRANSPMPAKARSVSSGGSHFFAFGLVEWWRMMGVTPAAMQALETFRRRGPFGTDSPP